MLPQSIENNNIEKYGFIDKDPIDEGNFFSNFILYWAYRIIRLSKLTNIKSEYLGKLSYKGVVKNICVIFIISGKI